MPGQLKRLDVEAAREDFKTRTLAHLGSRFGRVIYLASMRDYNTGHYYHDGLSFQFSEEAAERALAETHREEFVALTLSPLEEFVNQLQLYLRSVGAETAESIRVWERLEPYRVAIPFDSDPLTAQLFLANVKLALLIVESRQQAAP
jgi:hypothetical protein